LAYIGDGPETNRLRDRIKAQKLEDKGFLAEACATYRVALWLATADLFALPSYAEGCPNVVLDALSCGRPVIATAVGEIPDLVNAASGFLVAPRNTSALGAGIENALDRDWDERLISESFQRGWDQAAAELLAVCRSVSSRPQNRCAAPCLENIR
jgi:glycosyltransferase involved in cell wall biosynthesis